MGEAQPSAHCGGENIWGQMEKIKWFDKETTKLPLLAMCKISNVCDVNQNANKKGC
jgi:hypothetical protein